MTIQELQELALRLVPELRAWLNERLAKLCVATTDATHVISMLLPVGHETEWLEAHDKRHTSWPAVTFHCYACGRTCGPPKDHTICVHCHHIFHPSCLKTHQWGLWLLTQEKANG